MQGRQGQGPHPASQGQGESGDHGAQKGKIFCLQPSARTFGGWRLSQRGVACSGEGIEPAQTREPDELAVGGVQDSAVFDSESGYLSVGHEVARSAEVLEKFEYLFYMIRPGLQHLHRSLPQPGTNVSDGFFAGERVSESAGIGADAHESKQHHMEQPDRFGPGQAGLPPRGRFGMKR